MGDMGIWETSIKDVRDQDGRQEWETWEQGWEKWETGMGEMGDTSYTHLANISHTY